MVKARFTVLYLALLCLRLNNASGRSLQLNNRTRGDQEEDTPSPAPTNEGTETAQRETKPNNLESLHTIVQKAYPLRLFERFLEASQMSLTASEYSDTPFTVFMPWDKAFEKLPFDWVNRFKEPMWALHLRRFLLHHMLRGGLSIDILKQVASVTVAMMDGESVKITKKRDRVRMNDVRYLAYTAASDGYAFMMDEILVPSFMEQTAFLVAPPSLAWRWIKFGYKAELEDLLSDPAMAATFLVPSNDAFGAVDPAVIAHWESPAGKQDLRRVLLHHVVPKTLISSETLAPGIVAVEETLAEDSPVIFQQRPNGVLQINAAHVIKADIVAANGLVHIIDKVLLPFEERQVQVDGTTTPVVT